MQDTDTNGATNPYAVIADGEFCGTFATLDEARRYIVSKIRGPEHWIQPFVTAAMAMEPGDELAVEDEYDSTFELIDYTRYAQVTTDVKTLVAEVSEKFNSLRVQFSEFDYSPASYYDNDQDPILEDLAGDIRRLTSFWVHSSC